MSALPKPRESTIELVSPFPEERWPQVWSWLERFRGSVLDDFGPQTMDEFVEQRLTHEGPEYTWGVIQHGELGGIVTFSPANPIMGFAHTVFKKELWGQRTTLPALRMIAQEIFDLGFLKIVMNPFENNHAILALLKALGAKQEGVFKAHTLKNGVPINVCQYRLMREDLEEACQSEH